MKVQDIPTSVATRILHFFNGVQQVNDITNTLIRDDPSDGPGGTIGPTLARRILQTRSKQKLQRFDNLDQLDAISGFGVGTWKDLAYTFGRTAAAAFRHNLYANHIIYQANWPVWFFEFPIEDEKQFEELTFNDTVYRSIVSEKLEEIIQQEEVEESLAELAITGVKEAYLERFQDPTLSAVTFDTWFYRLDPGNWFSFDQMLAQTSAYIEYYDKKYTFQDIPSGDEMMLELVAFKGVPGNIMKPAGIAANDLITILNYPERNITIWMSTLYD